MSQLLSRQSWISACRFHDLTEADVLREVSNRVTQLKARATDRTSHPLVLLDLDSTLYEVSSRTYQILKEWQATEESRAHPGIRSALEALDVRQVGYSIHDTLRTLGVLASAKGYDEATHALKAFWAARFFTSEYLSYDHAYPGAAEFTRKIHNLGAEIVYLTGRDEPGMGAGTKENLIRDGFPWDCERTHLLLKAASHHADLEHKKNAAEYIRKHGTLVASFENEPPNLIALQEIFPEAMHVFVDTVCSDHGAKPSDQLYRIRHFGE
jgi:hypothetical protein